MILELTNVLVRNLALGCVGEYFRVAHTLTSFCFTPTSFDTSLALTALHPKLDGYFSFFFDDYEPDQYLKFYLDSFKLAFQCTSHLSANGFIGMVFEHF
jgi:hypothetical protein